MSDDKCLECGGPVSEAGTLYDADGDITGFGVRSTAAEQLVESNAENAELRAEVTAQQRQLADKKQELTAAGNTLVDLDQQLTAANAVVEDIRTVHQCSGRGCFVCAAIHKLQGGS